MQVSQQSLWNRNSPYQEVATELEKLIPVSGEIKGSKNKKLERYRKAMNCYYDLYNNGLINRSRSFARVFGLRPNDYRFNNGNFYTQLYVQLEPIMIEILKEAAAEQNIKMKGAL